MLQPSKDDTQVKKIVKISNIEQKSRLGEEVVQILNGRQLETPTVVHAKWQEIQLLQLKVTFTFNLWLVSVALATAP